MSDVLFNDDELLRYSRHILLPQIDLCGQQKLRDAHVLIVGAGGLGCPVALYLAASGVGRISVVDGDNVELSNLQRQIAHASSAVGISKAQSLAQRMRELNPLCQVQAITQWFSDENGAALVQGCDLVVDCCDNFQTRFLINGFCVKQRKPLVSGAAIRGEGQLAVFANDGKSPCYACVYPDSEDEGESCAQSGVIAPLVGVIGSLQALEAIKFLCGMRAPQAALLIYDAWQMEFRRLRIHRDAHCRVCGADQHTAQ